MAGIFKAYDIRGIVGDALSPERAYLIGRALAHELFSDGSVVVTRDMRTHGPQLAGELMRGLSEGGCRVLDFGLAATPMNYWAIASSNASGGVQVTASHNGPQYNGFKVSKEGAVPVDFAAGLDRVEAWVVNAEQNGVPAASSSPGAIEPQGDPLPGYLDWMQDFVRNGGRKLTLGIDCGNGMGGFFLPGFFERNPQHEVLKLYWELDGTFPNHEADPLKAENLVDAQNLVREQGCDFGVVYDGDADRCMFVDEKGDSVSSDLITALIAIEMLKAEKGPVLYDLRSSHSVQEVVQENGGEPVRSRVGHSFMKRLMRETGAQFGGELSGHYYFRALHNTDSGLMAMIQLLNIMSSTDATLSSLIAPIHRYAASGEINYRVSDAKAITEKVRQHYAAQNAKMDDLDGLTVELPDWWFNLRSSNTEPLLRLNLEAKTPEETQAHLAEVQSLLGAEPAKGH